MTTPIITDTPVERLKGLDDAAQAIDDAYTAADEEPCRCSIDELSCPHCNAWDKARNLTRAILSTIEPIPSAGEGERVEFDRDAFQKRASAILKDDVERNGRITDDGIDMIGAEAVFYALRALTLPSEPLPVSQTNIEAQAIELLASEYADRGGEEYLARVTHVNKHAALRALVASLSPVEIRNGAWHPISEAPPHHEDLLFWSDGYPVVGRVCYGFHAPRYADSLGNEFPNVTHWQAISTPQSKEAGR
jgi:hypothetical protein